MFRLAFVSLILIILFNSYSFLNESSIFFRIIGHGLFMPMLAVIYGIKRGWKLGLTDLLMFLACLIGSLCDVVIFLDLSVKGEFLQITTAFFVHLILIIIFRKEGAYVFNINNKHFLKILIPALCSFLFFGFVLLDILPNLLYFVAIIYAVQITILAVLGYYRPTSAPNYFLVALGVSFIMLKDILYSYFFYIYQGTNHLLYVPLYLSNALGYFLIVYGIALNQNDNKQTFVKISKKIIFNNISVFLRIT